MSFRKNGPLTRPSEEMRELLKLSGSKDPDIAKKHAQIVVKSLEVPLREAVLVGDILDGIYKQEPFDPGVPVEYPIDMVTPGNEKEYVAFTLPKSGYIPQKHVESDYVRMSTYPVGAALDWNLRYARDARWDIMRRVAEIIEAMFVKKNNDDGWRVILSAGVDRNIIVYDGDATAGNLTRRLVTLTQIIMRRNGGGNSGSTNRGKLTHLAVSPEAFTDVRHWNLDQVPDDIRRQFYVSSDQNLEMINVHGTMLFPLDELGEGQEYQNYFTSTLGGSLQGSDVELGVGLDLSKNDAFVMPVVETVEMFNDPNLHREQRQGVYGWAEHGFGVLDNRRVILVSM